MIVARLNGLVINSGYLTLWILDDRVCTLVSDWSFKTVLFVFLWFEVTLQDKKNILTWIYIT